jgi:hypothetical protein
MSAPFSCLKYGTILPEGKIKSNNKEGLLNNPCNFENYGLSMTP